MRPHGSIAPVAKTVIVSEGTARELMEAYASLAAWFYQLSDAMRASGVGCEPPSDAQRQAYLAQLAAAYPELHAVAAALGVPRPYIPPPVLAGPVTIVENAGIDAAPPPPPAEAGPAPPAIVDPGAVRY